MDIAGNSQIRSCAAPRVLSRAPVMHSSNVSVDAAARLFNSSSKSPFEMYSASMLVKRALSAAVDLRRRLLLALETAEQPTWAKVTPLITVNNDQAMEMGTSGKCLE